MHAETAADPSLTVYARTRPFVVPPSGRAAASAASTRVSSGELLDAPDGKAIGSFVTNCICEVGGAVHGIAHPSPEFQALELKARCMGCARDPARTARSAMRSSAAPGGLRGARRLRRTGRRHTVNTARRDPVRRDAGGLKEA